MGRLGKRKILGNEESERESYKGTGEVPLKEKHAQLNKSITPGEIHKTPVK